MTTPQTPDSDEIICECSGTTRGKIVQLVDQGIVDLDTLSRKTGAVSGCGGCEWEIEALLQQLLVK